MRIDMQNSDKLAVFGSGAFASRCVKWLRQITKREIFVFEKKLSPISILERQVSKLDRVLYYPADDDTENRVLEINPMVIFSIGNTFLFSETLTERFPIINYHNALLPLHPGRNAEAWAIFSQDKTAGVTWHFAETKVDAGEIILQGQIPIGNQMTSIQLLSQQAKLAFPMFRTIASELLRGQRLGVRKQLCMTGVKFHFSWERPNDGILDMSWNYRKMSAFLRSMDYGKINTLGRPKLMANHTAYVWDKYLLNEVHGAEDSSMVFDKENAVFMGKDCSIELIGLRQIIETTE